MYSEGEKVSLATGINNTLSLYASLCFLYIPPLRRLLLSKGIIPNPGTGPSLKTQEVRNERRGDSIIFSPPLTLLVTLTARLPPRLGQGHRLQRWHCQVLHLLRL